MHTLIYILVIGTVFQASIVCATDDDIELDGFDFESDTTMHGDALDKVNQLNTVFDVMENDEPDSFSEKEKRIKLALLRSTSDIRNRRIFTQLLPILRSLSKTQRTAMAALIVGQLSLEPGQELSLSQAEGFFGDKRELLLPVLLDIANVIKDLTNNRNHGHSSHAAHRHHATKRSIQQFLDEPLASASMPNKRNKRSTAPASNKSAPISITENIPSKNTTKLIHSQSNELYNEVHVTLPSASNITLTLDEYEDLALGDLNGTDMRNNRPGMLNGSLPLSIGNGTAPEAAMLISGRIRYPAGNKVGIGKQRPCEFGSICIRVEDYPLNQIMRSINRHKNAMSALLADQPPIRNFDLKGNDVPIKEALTSGNKRRDSDDDEDSIPGGMCPSIVRYARPQKARSAKGEWKYIVNTGQHTQTLRLEKCTNPEHSCSYLTDNFKSRCLQIYNYHRLLSWDHVRGLHVDIFKIPTCCSCHIDGYREEFPPTNSYSSGVDEFQDNFHHPTQTKTKYSTIFEDDDDFEDYDNLAKGSVAYHYSNGFRKTPPVPYTTSYADVKISHHTPEITKKSRKPSVGINGIDTYLTPPNVSVFDGDGSFQHRIRRPQRKQASTGNGFHQSPLSPFAEHQSKRRVSVSNIPSAEKKIPMVNTNLPSISPAVTAVQELGNRVNYNYHPIIDFFSDSMHARKRI